jgi:hypothetical protein
VINWYSFVLTAGIGGWIHKYWFPGLPWDQATMILTGEAAYRTPGTAPALGLRAGRDGRFIRSQTPR